MSRATTHVTFSRTEIEEIAYILAVLDILLAADDAPTGAWFPVAGETHASMANWIGDVRADLHRRLFPKQ